MSLTFTMTWTFQNQIKFVESKVKIEAGIFGRKLPKLAIVNHPGPSFALLPAGGTCTYRIGAI